MQELKHVRNNNKNEFPNKAIILFKMDKMSHSIQFRTKILIINPYWTGNAKQTRGKML